MLLLPIRSRRRTWSIIFAVVAAAASAYLGIAGYFPSLASGPVVVIVAGLALTAAIGLIALPLREDHHEREHRDAVDAVRDALNTACVTFGRLTNQPVEKFAATLLIARPTRYGDELIGVVTGGLAHHPPSGVTWRADVGIVGRCWRTRTSQFHDLNPTIQATATTTRQQWDALGPDLTMNLTHQEWLRTRTSFGTIVAACVYPRLHAAGVVSIDIPPGIDVSSLETTLIQAAEATAFALKDLVK